MEKLIICKNFCLKMTIISILLLWTAGNINCQEISSLSNSGNISIYNTDKIKEKVEEYVNEEINKWQQKGFYEKTEDYKKRVTAENRQKLIDELTQNKVNEIANKIVKLNLENYEYDADNEVYKLEFYDIPPVYVKVPIEAGEAQSFNDNIKYLQFKNAKFTITEDNKFALLYLNIYNPSNKKEYTYDINEKIQFKNQKLVYNFGPVRVNIKNESIQQVYEDSGILAVGQPDVDINIPETKTKKPNTYALIIGNEDYTKYQPTLTSESNVKFAINDAQIFAQYCYYTLGIPKENIKISTNVISSQMKRDIEWLISRIKYIGEDVEIIFYYSGHGFPDENTKEKYLIPVDISGTQVTDGIKLSQLYKDLTQYKCKRVTVFLDACFSGSGREEGLLAAKSVKIAPKEDMIFEGNLLVFSSSKGAQRSFFYKEKQHGLFSYYLLKKLQETSGNITYGELKNYLAKEVPLKSIDLYQEEQIPEVSFSLDIEGVWEGWTVR